MLKNLRKTDPEKEERFLRACKAKDATAAQAA
jgi:hypothetical protein